MSHDPTTAVVTIDYTNHRGERRDRRIVPRRLWFGESPWHPGKQWLLDAWDVEAEAMRTFAVAAIHSWGHTEGGP